MRQNRRKFISTAASIGLAGFTLGSTTTVAAASSVPDSVKRDIEITSQDLDTVEYSASLQTSNDPDYVDSKDIDGELDTFEEATAEFVGPVSSISVDNTVKIELDGFDTERWQEDTDDTIGYPWISAGTGSGKYDLVYEIDDGGADTNLDNNGEEVALSGEIDGFTSFDNPEWAVLKEAVLRPDDGEQITIY